MKRGVIAISLCLVSWVLWAWSRPDVALMVDEPVVVTRPTAISSVAPTPKPTAEPIVSAVVGLVEPNHVEPSFAATNEQAVTADLAVEIVPHARFVTKGERLGWDIVVRNLSAGAVIGVMVRITVPDGVIDVRVSAGGWDCDYTTVVKTVVCRGDLAAGEPIAELGLGVLVPRGTTADLFSAAAQVESGLPDPILQNNRAETAVSVAHIWEVAPPSGFLFTHIDQLGLKNRDHLAADYLGDELITAVLQVPFGIGLGYHQERPPSVCLVPERPCPPEEIVIGQVILSSYKIKRVVQLGGIEEVVFAGDIERELYKITAAVPADCTQGRCVGYGLYEAAGFGWGRDQLVTIYPFTKGGRKSDCVAGCIDLIEGKPGYYRIESEVVLESVFQGMPELGQRYIVETESVFQLMAPFVESVSRCRGGELC